MHGVLILALRESTSRLSTITAASEARYGGSPGRFQPGIDYVQPKQHEDSSLSSSTPVVAPSGFCSAVAALRISQRRPVGHDPCRKPEPTFTGTVIARFCATTHSRHY